MLHTRGNASNSSHIQSDTKYSKPTWNQGRQYNMQKKPGLLGRTTNPSAKQPCRFFSSPSSQFVYSCDNHFPFLSPLIFRATIYLYKEPLPSFTFTSCDCGSPATPLHSMGSLANSLPPWECCPKGWILICIWQAFLCQKNLQGVHNWGQLLHKLVIWSLWLLQLQT